MKVRGETLQSRATGAVVIPRPAGDPITLAIKALPLGWLEEVDRRLPEPEGRVKFARDERGKLLRDNEGKYVTVPDTRPEYRQAVKRNNRLQTVAVIERALVDGGDVTFETQQRDAGAWCDYYESIHAELEAAGLSLGDIDLICTEVLRVSNMDEEALEAARADFTDPAAAASATVST